MLRFERNSHRPYGDRRRVVATAAFDAHTQLFTEKPLFATHFFVSTAPAAVSMIAPDSVLRLNARNTTDALLDALRTARDAVREAAVRDAVCAPEDVTLHSIIHDNHFVNETCGIKLAYGAAFYPLLSSVNHSCAPNCMIVSGPHQEARLVSLRPIGAEEEITVAYADFGADDCAAAWSGGAPQTPVLPFECRCVVCRAYTAAPHPHYTFDVDSKHERLFRLLLERVQHEMQLNNRYAEHYKLMRLLMAQKEPWKRFTRSAKMGSAVVHLGLEAVKSALLTVAPNKWATDAYFLAFINEWTRILGSAPCNAARHIFVQQRMGILLCNFVHKFCRLIGKHSTLGESSRPLASFKDLPDSRQKSLLEAFGNSFRTLLEHAANDLFVEFDELECLDALQFHCLLLNVAIAWQLADSLYIRPVQSPVRALDPPVDRGTPLTPLAKFSMTASALSAHT